VSNDTFTVTPETENTARPQRGPKPKAAMAMEPGVPEDAKRTRVIFMEASGPGGSERVRAIVDGVAYTYARNEEVDVPDFVLEALDHAAPAEMDPTTGNMRRVPRFPYQVVR
jgi:hypothetical protein